jgi:hypothetical protein
MVNSSAAPTSTIAIALINSGSLALLLSATCQKAVRNLPSLCTQETAFSARRISPIGWPDQCILNVRKFRFSMWATPLCGSAIIFFLCEPPEAGDRRRCTFRSAWRDRKCGRREAMRQPAVILAVVIRGECGQVDVAARRLWAGSSGEPFTSRGLPWR